MSFAFGFSGDDIEDDDDDEMAKDEQMETSSEIGDRGPSSIEHRAQKEDISQLLSSLPSRISYSSLVIKSPRLGHTALVLRRALFDVKMQLMAESDGDNDANLDQLDAGLGGSDIEQNVYEGGFKSWEGAVDLAQLLLDGTAGQGTESLKSTSHVIELGSGTAIPSLTIFQRALHANIPLNLTLADYNASVLRLVTLPNLLLTWCLHHTSDAFSPAPPSINTSSSSIEIPTGDLDITPALLESFTADLAQRGITLTLVSGGWAAGAQYTSLLSLPTPLSISSHDASTQTYAHTLILAAETIYSPASLRAFTATLLALLDLPPRGTASALVAAKRVYFGVGGGVDEFITRVAQGGGRVAEVHGSQIAGCDGALKGGGVGRWIGQVWVD